MRARERAPHKSADDVSDAQESRRTGYPPRGKRRAFLARVGKTPKASELEADLVDPETLQAAQADVRTVEILTRDVADGLKRAQMTIEELAQHVAHGFAFARQTDQHRASVDFGAFVMDVSTL